MFKINEHLSHNSVCTCAPSKFQCWDRRFQFREGKCWNSFRGVACWRVEPGTMIRKNNYFRTTVRFFLCQGSVIRSGVPFTGFQSRLRAWNLLRFVSSVKICSIRWFRFRLKNWRVFFCNIFEFVFLSSFVHACFRCWVNNCILVCCHSCFGSLCDCCCSSHFFLPFVRQKTVAGFFLHKRVARTWRYSPVQWCTAILWLQWFPTLLCLFFRSQAFVAWPSKQHKQRKWDETKSIFPLDTNWVSKNPNITCIVFRVVRLTSRTKPWSKSSNICRRSPTHRCALKSHQQWKTKTNLVQTRKKIK